MPGTGTFPFVDVDNRLVVSGAGIGFSPGVLQGKSMAQIADDLSDPTNSDTQAVLGAANKLSAAICAATGGKPVVGVHVAGRPGRSQPAGPALTSDPGAGVSRRDAAGPACARSR